MSFQTFWFQFLQKFDCRVQFFNPYPVSQPKLKLFNWDVLWVSPGEFEGWEAGQLNEHKITGKVGIIKCLVSPPRSPGLSRYGYSIGQTIPVLPSRDSDRLLFSYCRTCSKDHKFGRVIENYSCPHTNEKDRMFVTTTTRDELKLALENGYVVRKIYRVYTFNKFVHLSI